MHDSLYAKQAKGMLGGAIDPIAIRDLIAISIKALCLMQHESGVFCEKIFKGDSRKYGVSIRYTIMVLLGLERARAAGLSHPFEEERIRELLLREIVNVNITPGDLGLCLWLVGRCRAEHSNELIVRLKARIEAAGGLSHLQGMEVAWIVIGLAFTAKFTRSASNKIIFQQALTELVRRQDSKTGLLYHLGTNHYRRWLPNFATQIYGVLAFATVADLGLDDRVLLLAQKTADRLIDLQLPDGGWPWLFNARTGMVAEPYEIYSVHQHGMAPMAFLKLTEVSRDSRYAKAALKGLEWINGSNELRKSMVDHRECLIYRSIRRKKPFNNIALYLNAGLSFILNPKVIGWKNSTELNLTCCPYELGWLLEAWSGRDSFLNIR
jgi:hypothetical protein